MKKKIYILTGYDEWLTHVLIKRIIPLYDVTLIKVSSVSNDFLHILKLVILFGLIDFLKILFIHYKEKNYKIIKLEEKNLNNYLKMINKNKIFLVNYPFKIKKNFTNIYNCHPSLLPNYSGLLPIPKKIFDITINKKKSKFGLTIHKINNKFDGGRIVWNKSINLDLKRNRSFKKNYEIIYENFFYGLRKICSSQKINCIKVVKNSSLKKTITFYEIFLLKIKLL